MVPCDPSHAVSGSFRDVRAAREHPPKRHWRQAGSAPMLLRMGLFGIGGRQPAGYSIIAERLTVHGEIDTEGAVRVDGCIEGKVHRAGTLIIGPTGVVE